MANKKHAGGKGKARDKGKPKGPATKSKGPASKVKPQSPKGKAPTPKGKAPTPKGKAPTPKRGRGRPKKDRTGKPDVVPKGPRQKYDKAVAIMAAREYMAGVHDSLRIAARHYGIPVTTVRDYKKMILDTISSGGQEEDVKAKHCGAKHTIPKDYELKIAEHCAQCGQRGFGKSKGLV